MSDVHEFAQRASDAVQGPDEPPLPWEGWSKQKRQQVAFGIAGGLVLLGAVVGLLTLWS
jgi:hypothetical protein